MAKDDPALDAEIRRSIDDFLSELGKPNNQPQIHDQLARTLALYVREGQKVDGVALTQIPATDGAPDGAKANVLRVVFENLPVPNESCSLEEIIDFSREAREQNLVQRLRVFTTELAGGGLTVADVRDRLAHLSAEHSLALQHHRRAARRGALETVLVAGAEIVAALKTGRFSAAAGAAVGLSASNASLLLGEMGLPGREVAYLVRSHEQFGR